MAKHLLSSRGVHTAQVGDHTDGAGLFLRVTATGSSWILRFTAPNGKRREGGLGAAERDTLASAGSTLAQARKLADKALALLANGVDPVEQRKADREAAQAKAAAARASIKAEGTTLARHARLYHERCVEPRRTTKHAAQWIASLEQGIPASIWHQPIADVNAPELLEALAALQLRVPETASRVRQRLDAVFDDAMFLGLCSTNPAKAVKRRLADRPSGKTKGRFAALPYADVPGFVAALRTQPGIAARALEFALLTAARTGEVLGAAWHEVDALAGRWTVPAERMKGGEEHVVHLPARALELVEQMRELQGDPWVFPSSADRSRQMSNMAMLTLLRRMGLQSETTVHGLCRASFSTWAHETGAARPEVIEAALAHQEEDRVKAAYNRASFTAERRALLSAWAAFCNGEQPAIVERPSATVHALPVAA